MRTRSTLIAAALLFTLVAALAQPTLCAELDKETAAAFDRYIRASEKRINTEIQTGQVLFVDAMTPKKRAAAYEQMRKQQIVLQQVNAKEEGHPIEVPHGLIHDWVGAIFIPGASLSDVLAVVQDYENHENIYKPEVRVSKLVMHTGDEYRVFLQLYKKSVVTVAINADFDIYYDHLAPGAVAIRSYSTRLAEIENVDRPNARELAVDGGHGYLWRLFTYWRIQEKDGGVYVQIESIGLSRSVPAVFAWIVNPLLRSIPRGTLSSLLSATRTAVLNRTNARSFAESPM